jgi:hypothetical protein
VQAQGTAQVNSPATFNFNGSQLSSSVLVTVSNCENPKTELINSSQIKHSCVPRIAGAQTAAWKASSAVANPVTLGTVNVVDPRSSIGSGSLASKVDAFVNAWTNKPIDFDKSYGYQCVDLMRQFAQDVLGMNSQFPRGNAYAIFSNMSSTTTLKKVLNTPAAVPSKGDVIFWHPAASNGQAGHVAIFVEGNSKQFSSFDQNYCKNTGSGIGECAPRKVVHNYDGVAGWITTNTAPPPPPPTPVALNIQSISTSAPTVAVNQNLSFNVTVDNPAAVEKVNLMFPVTNVTEAMAQVAGAATWSRTRTMSSAGNNLAYEVWVYKKGDAANPIKRAGTYSVTPISPPVRDGMSFLSGSLAQNTEVRPQTNFSASWTLKNSGSTTWNNQYCLKPRGNAGVNAGNVCVNGTVAPDKPYTFTTNLQSPAATASDQPIRQEWDLFNASNVKVDSPVWISILVKARAAPPPPPSPPPSAPKITQLQGEFPVGGTPKIQFTVFPSAKSAVAITRDKSTFTFQCGSGSSVICTFTGNILKTFKGPITVDVEALDANGRASGKQTITLSR